jgi:hypothetical protein
MFRKGHVTGESAAIPGEQEAGDNREYAILLDDDGEAAKKITPGKRKEEDNRLPKLRTISAGLLKQFTESFRWY